MIIQVEIGNGRKRPKVRKNQDGTWSVVGEAAGCVQWTRAVWVRSYKKEEEQPKDGKGFLVSGTGKLSAG